MSEDLAIKILSFFAGLALGWMHFRVYHRMLEAMMAKRQNTRFRRQAVVGGISRHLLSLAAGICLVKGAGLDPLPLCGGLILTTAIYRVYVLRMKPERGGEHE